MVKEDNGDDLRMNKVTKLIKGIYLISNHDNETLITLIPENGFAYEQTKKILDKNNETSIILQHPQKGGILYQYKETQNTQTNEH